jgi:hypothetical protein
VTTENTVESDCVKCPYCGHRHTDPQEYFSNNQEDTEIECVNEACGRVFAASQVVSIDYIGRPLKLSARYPAAKGA